MSNSDIEEAVLAILKTAGELSAEQGALDATPDHGAARMRSPSRREFRSRSAYHRFSAELWLAVQRLASPC
jgi:hypothetical protein